MSDMEYAETCMDPEHHNLLSQTAPDALTQALARIEALEAQMRELRGHRHGSPFPGPPPTYWPKDNVDKAASAPP